MRLQIPMSLAGSMDCGRVTRMMVGTLGPPGPTTPPENRNTRALYHSVTLAEDGGCKQRQGSLGRVGDVERLKEAVPIRGLPAIGTTS